jgi:hypothetical protein
MIQSAVRFPGSGRDFAKNDLPISAARSNNRFDNIVREKAVVSQWVEVLELGSLFADPRADRAGSCSCSGRTLGPSSLQTFGSWHAAWDSISRIAAPIQSYFVLRRLLIMRVLAVESASGRVCR